MDKLRSLKVDVEKMTDGLPVIFRIQGVLDAQTSPKLEKRIFSFLNQGHSNIVINLKDLDYISSAGLRTLMTASRKIDLGNGKLVLCTPSKNVFTTMSNSGFETFFKIKATEKEALKCF